MVDILEILELVNSRSLLGILNEPEELRCAILALEYALKFLKENEQQLYPEQAPRSGRTRRNEVVGDINDPSWQLNKILRVFQRIHQPLTPAQLHGQYIKGVDATLLEARCDELVALNELVVLDAKRGDSRKYCLPSDLPPESEPAEPPGPKVLTHLTLSGQSVAVYSVSNQAIIGVKDDYNLVVNHDQSLAFRISSKDGRKIHEWNLSTGFDHLDANWMDPDPPEEP